MDQWETAGRVGGAPAGDASGYPAPTWALGAPKTRYAKSEDGYVAYQVFGGGPFDLLFIGNWASNIEVMWEHPSMARYLNRLGRFARVICFDKRGAGLSDPVSLGALPTLEHWIDDARIVLDAVGSTGAALIGDAEGGPMAMMFAATYPQRTRALVLVNTFAKLLRAADYPIGMPEEAAERLLQIWEASWVRELCSNSRLPASPATRRCSAGLAAICDSRPHPGRPPACIDGCFRWTCGRSCRPSKLQR
jgi:pimeloyl-ACP methyl ester carboxylesterase